CRDGAAEAIGEFLVDRVREVIERARLVEAGHLHRPLDRRPVAANREPAVGLARDRDDAAVDLRRIGRIHGKLGLARLLALIERRIVKEGKAYRALDFQRAYD